MRKTNTFVFLMFMLMHLCLCLCANENSIRQISGFVLLMFLLMLTLMSGVFSLVMLMLCLCASENQPLGVKNTSSHAHKTGSWFLLGVKNTSSHTHKTGLSTSWGWKTLQATPTKRSKGMRRKSLIEWPGWLKCVETGVGLTTELIEILYGAAMFSKVFVELASWSPQCIVFYNFYSKLGKLSS